MNVFGGFVNDLNDNIRTRWPHQREIKSLAGPKTKVLMLTGTPIKNRLDELFALVNFLDPRSFPDIKEFVQQWHEPQWWLDHNRRVTGTPLQDLSALCSKLRHTVLIRRPLTELQEELPTLTRKVVTIRHADYDGDVSSIDNCPHNEVVIGLKSNSVLQDWFMQQELRINRILKQLSENDLPRDEREYLEEQLKILLTVTRERTGACKHQIVLPYLMQCRQKTVVFGWHRELIEDLAFKLRQAGRGVVTFIGGTKEPDKVVERFQEDDRVQFFLGNIDCASTSITLTAAHHVVLAEQSWVPSDEDQSIARVWRTTQKHPVTVVKFLLDCSLDGRMQAAQNRKRKFIARALDGEESSTSVDKVA